MAKTLVVSRPVSDNMRHHLRMIRNDCRKYMTHNRDEITADQQDEFWASDARKEMHIRLYWSYGAVPVAYGSVQVIDGKKWLTGGVMGGWRGRGIGRQVFMDLMGSVVDDGDKEVWLDVLEANAPARALYESLGFKYVEGVSSIYKEPGFPALVMRKTWE